MTVLFVKDLKIWQSIKSYNFTTQIVQNFLDIIKQLGYNISIEISKEVTEMSITATELKQNLGKYLMLAATEDVFITRNGKIVAKLSNPYQDRVDVAKSLFGIIQSDITVEEARDERLNKI